MHARENQHFAPELLHALGQLDKLFPFFRVWIPSTKKQPEKKEYINCFALEVLFACPAVKKIV
jgi:hypothetical protein